MSFSERWTPAVVGRTLEVPDADIYVLGWGLELPAHLTLETLAILDACKRLFGVPAFDASSLGVPQVEDLSHIYGDTSVRRDAYRRMADRVMTAAKSSGPVAFITYGHPCVGSDVTRELVAGASERGLTVHVANAVSSIDALFPLLSIDPFSGLLVCEATTFLNLGLRPDTNIWLVLTQVPAMGIETVVDRTTPPSEPDISALVARLGEFYPRDHTAAVVRARSYAGAASIEWQELGRLRFTHASDPATVAIPPDPLAGHAIGAQDQ